MAPSLRYTASEAQASSFRVGLPYTQHRMRNNHDEQRPNDAEVSWMLGVIFMGVIPRQDWDVPYGYLRLDAPYAWLNPLYLRDLRSFFSDWRG